MIILIFFILEEEWEIHGDGNHFTDDSLFLLHHQWEQPRRTDTKSRKDHPKKTAQITYKQQVAQIPPIDNTQQYYQTTDRKQQNKRNPLDRQRSPSPISPRHRFAEAREKFRMMEKGNKNTEYENKKQINNDKNKEIKRQPSRSREDMNFPKSDKDTGYVSKDSYGVRDAGYGSRGYSRERDLSPNYGDRYNRDYHERKHWEMEDKQRAGSKEFDVDCLTGSGSCESIPHLNYCDKKRCDIQYGSSDPRYLSSPNLEEYQGNWYRNQAIETRNLPETRKQSFLNHDNDRRRVMEKEVNRNKSFTDLENHRRQEMRNKSDDDLHEFLRNRENNDYNQAVNKQFLNKVKRFSGVYNELPVKTRPPGLDRDTARVTHNSLQHLPTAKGPQGPLANRPPYERSQSEKPKPIKHSPFSRYSYAEPSNYQRGRMGLIGKDTY